LVIGRPFTGEEHQRIHEAIAQLEHNTAADLDLVVVRSADRYSLYPLIWAAVTALAITATVVMLRPAIPARIALALQFAILIVATLIFDFLPVRVRLVPQRVKRAHARQLSHHEFGAPHARGGPSRKRILLFVSLGERYVEIIADHETYAAVDRDLWDKTVSDFVSAVQAALPTVS